MRDIKQSFQIAFYNFRLWKKNPRVIMTFALAFVLCLMLSDKAVSLARSYGTNMQILEAFVWTFGDGNSIMISSLLLILLFADMPFISQGTPYYLYRTKRSLWVWGAGNLCSVCYSALYFFLTGGQLYHLRSSVFSGEYVERDRGSSWLFRRWGKDRTAGIR